MDDLNKKVKNLNMNMKLILKEIRKKWHKDISYDPLMRSFGSYFQNEAVRVQNVAWEESEIYQYFKSVHKLMTLYGIKGEKTILQRVGGTHDGGYIMLMPFSEAKVAYSIGIGNNVEWDRQMAENGYEIFMYDHTIENLPEENMAFHWRKKGIRGGRKSENDNLITLKEMLRQNGHEECRGMVLKMDVEGAEWEALCSMDEQIFLQFDQIVIELHELLNLNLKDKILKSLKKLNDIYAVVHLHGNNSNAVEFCGELITPNVLEATLVRRDKYEFVESQIILPRIIDRSCVECFPDIKLGCWNIKLKEENPQIKEAEEVIGL